MTFVCNNILKKLCNFFYKSSVEGTLLVHDYALTVRPGFEDKPEAYLIKPYTISH